MNNITRNKPIDYLPFQELQVSDTFFVKGNNYMKTQNHEGNAVNLNTGFTTTFANSDLVTTITVMQITKQTTTLEFS